MPYFIFPYKAIHFYDIPNLISLTFFMYVFIFTLQFGNDGLLKSEYGDVVELSPQK